MGEKYRERLNKAFKGCYLLKAAEKIAQEAQQIGTWNEELQKKYEDIDVQATGVMKNSEQTCQAALAAKHSRSDVLVRHGSEMRYQNLRKMQSTKDIVPHTFLLKARKVAQVIDNTATIGQIEEQWKKTKKTK